MKNRINLEKLAKGFCSTDELKPALLGVGYNIEENEFCMTDGHKLFVLKNVSDHISIEFSESEKNDIILPIEILAEYEKRTKKYSLEYCLKYCRLLVTGDGSYADPYFIEYQERKSSEKPFKTYAGAECIAERYPDYKSVIPSWSDLSAVEQVGVNPVYLNQMWLAVKSISPKAAPVIRLNFQSEISPILVKFFADHEEINFKYDCLIMPVRS